MLVECPIRYRCDDKCAHNSVHLSMEDCFGILPSTCPKCIKFSPIKEAHELLNEDNE